MSAAVKHKPPLEVQAKMEQYSPEELSRLVKLGETVKQKQDEGRSLGRIHNAARATTHRDMRLKKAARLAEERPYLVRDLDLFTVEMFKWCRDQTLKLKNGKNYSLFLIRQELQDAGYGKSS